MIFLGDFVYPFKEKRNIYNFSEEFKKENKFLNLEGAIIDSDKYKVITKGTALSSSLHTYDILKSLNVKAVGLANNHIYDYDININEQKEELEKLSILSCGADQNIDEALKPVLLEDDTYRYAILSFGWNVIGCKNANKIESGVAPIIDSIIIETISKVKKEYADRKIILYLHWNYEFEYYPQPADRKLAFDSIDVGADAIIGHHPHIVGTYEIYENKPIIYSLGNFFMHTSMGFGESAQEGLGVKYDDDIENIKLYWIKNISDQLSLSSEENLCISEKLENITNLYQDDLNEYFKWFKINRRKKKLLPIYISHNESIKNKLLYKLLKLRNYIVHNLTASGLRKRNN